jgi:hypothetical protein
MNFLYDACDYLIINHYWKEFSMFNKLISIVLAMSSVGLLIGCSNDIVSVTGQTPVSAAWVGTNGATDVGCGGGNVFAVSKDLVGGGYKCYKWNSPSWTLFDGGLLRIDADQNGHAWGVNQYNYLYERTSNNTWIWHSEVNALDVAIGDNGTRWIISDEAADGGYCVKKWNGTTWAKPSIGGAGIRIAVDPAGNPWVVNNYSNLLTIVSGQWYQYDVNGAANNATDVGVGSDGTVWIISHETVNGGYNIYKKVGSTFSNAHGGAIAISVNWTTPWVVNNGGYIFELVNGSWISR